MQKTLLLKYLRRFSSLDYIALITLCIAVVIRVALVAGGWTVAVGDEAIFQLEALHIFAKGELPIFFYGQNYMGATEAYIAAGLFKIFGPSIFLVRIEMIALYVLFLFLLYQLTTRLYTKAFALCVLIIMSVGSARMLQLQIEATGGIPEINVCGVAALLIVAHLTLARNSATMRGILYALWGCMIGLALWSDVLIAPYLLVAGLLLLAFHGREVVKWGVWPLLAGLLVGAGPLIYYNLTCMPGNDTITTFLHLYTMGKQASDSILLHIKNTALVSLPVMTGFQTGGFLMAYPSSQPHALLHFLSQIGWSVGYCLLLLSTLGMALRAIWSKRTLQSDRESIAEEKRHERFRQCARLALALGAMLTIFFYVKGTAPVIDDYNSARYLSIIWISTPAVLWPLWSGLSNLGRQIQRFELLRSPRLLFSLARLSILLIIAVICLRSTITTSGLVPQAQAQQHNLSQVAQTLEGMHVTRFYSDYATCNALMLETQDRLICGDTWGNLTHGVDRYFPYRVQMKEAINPGFVYPVASGRVAELEKALASTHTPYQRIKTGSYIIYSPAHRIPGLALYQWGF